MRYLLLLVVTFLSLNFIKAQSQLQSATCPIITAKNVTPPSCFGSSMGSSIAITYTLGTPNYVIEWGSPISQTITTSASSNTILNVSSGIYTFTITDVNGCSVTDFVSVSQPQNLSLITSPTQNICYGQNAQIYATGSGGTPGYTYSWTPSPFIGGGPHTVNPTSTTTYTVNMTDANGCSVPTKIITVVVSPPLSLTTVSYSVCDGAIVNLSPGITSPGNGSPYNFAWSNGVNHNGVQSSSISVVANAASTPNQYTVTIDDGCTIPSASAVFTINVATCTGIDELTNNSISIYPNPANNFLYIESQNISEKSIIELYNSFGQKVKSERLNDINTQFNLNDLACGIYQLQILNNGLIIHQTKIIKED